MVVDNNNEGTGKLPRDPNITNNIVVISDNISVNTDDHGNNKHVKNRIGINDDRDIFDNRIRKKSKIAISSNKTKNDKLRLQSPETNEKNKYIGWTVPSHNYQIPTITLGSDDEMGNMTAKRFYEEYVRIRRPVVLNGNNGSKKNILQEFEKMHNKWRLNNDYLKQRAENEHVMVEVRSDEKGTFGKGNETAMSFGNFCSLQEKGDTMHYLTTQDVEANDDGRPELMAPFMKALRTGGDHGVGDGIGDDDDSCDFPLRPKLAGNLVPQNINMWMGNTSHKQGTSSGLHHDYHDNFYIMVRGRKRFRLYSPADTEKIYTRGKMHLVHPNGRVNYEGDVTTAYGADINAHAAAKASDAKDSAERKLAEAEKSVLEGREGAHQELEQAEKMLDEAMDALIDAEMYDEDNGSLGDNEFSDDEYLCHNDDGTCDHYRDAAFCTNKSSNRNNESQPVNYTSSEDEREASNNMKKKHIRRLVDKTVKNPDNFSRIEAHLLDNNAQLTLRYPHILNAKSAFCIVNAGDVLYLPASWFHEVVSFGNSCKKDNENDDDDTNDNLGHLALNYWFHPPDALNNFEHPYSTEFWPNDYERRFAAKINKKTS